MKKTPRHAAAAVLLSAACLAPFAGAQAATQAPRRGVESSPSASPQQAQPAPRASSEIARAESSAKLFYGVLLGELSVGRGSAGDGYALLLDAARQTGDARLYQRATEIALQARSGDSALLSARAWVTAQPESREANRFVLQILVALNRIEESAAPLRKELEFARSDSLILTYAAIPVLYARASDKNQARAVVEQALAGELQSPANPAQGAAAWVAVGRMRLAAGDSTGTLEAAQRAQALEPTAEGPAILALELLDPKNPLAEPIVRKYLEGRPTPPLRMAYASALLENQRGAEAMQQVLAITEQTPDFADAWLLLGNLQLQDDQPDRAEASVRRYLSLVDAEVATAAPDASSAGASAQQAPARRRVLDQAYLLMAQIAEKRGDLPAVESWLDKVESPQALLNVQMRRASVLARQGKLEDGRRLIRAVPARTPADARLKLMAEVQLLRDNDRRQDVYDLLAQASAQNPTDPDLLYDQAMAAERLDRIEDAERLLREVIRLRPDYHHAYNALGFSLADRNVRLPEAKQLIQKALEFVPDDPFINDSLGWVEFRLGNRAEARRILEKAYTAKPDAEIAAHLGEVLWTAGDKDRARAVWREGRSLNPDNETLEQTLKRLGVRP
jgi:tetratricopeptide (TPR) repeat protein